ncbi:DUF4167 domain-containing protein [Blastomonas sp. AAP53]|uniref:DUF4167 domain-containing protein n=1 Tax=Blastomonas sp. AAP53 TaxID=1248760 RepID=UPI00030BC378|nr:DUF4167 domain-containing protein [Blastomonas sp. AAP53]
MNNNRGTSRRRGRGNNRPQPSGRSGGMDQGNRIDSRARGNATQMLEKYKKMAHDAQMNGDRVATEYYLQFADHYFRVLADNRARQDEYRRPREEQNRDNGSDYADDDDDMGFNSSPSPRNYSQDQSDEASARSGQDDDGDDQDDNRGNRGNGNQRNEGRQSEGRQNEGRRERRPREDNQERQGQERQGQDRQNQERQGQERQGRPRSDRQEQAPRAAAPAPAPSPAPAATPATETEDQSGAPRRILRGRGRPPRAVEAEASNGLDPMILPPAIGVPAEDKTDAEAPKPKRRAAPRRKAAESGDVEAAAAE